MGDRHWRFVKVDTGEEAFEASRIIAEQKETLRLYEERVRNLLNEIEALKLQMGLRQPANVTRYEPVTMEE